MVWKRGYKPVVLLMCTFKFLVELQEENAIAAICKWYCVVGSGIYLWGTDVNSNPFTNCHRMVCVYRVWVSVCRQNTCPQIFSILHYSVLVYCIYMYMHMYAYITLILTVDTLGGSWDPERRWQYLPGLQHFLKGYSECQSTQWLCSTFCWYWPTPTELYPRCG